MKDTGGITMEVNGLPKQTVKEKQQQDCTDKTLSLPSVGITFRTKEFIPSMY